MNPAETTIEVAGAKLTVRTEALFKAWMEKTIGQPKQLPNTGNNPPRIGAAWPSQGGIYVGILRGENGAPDYHLVHAAVEHELTGANWEDACAGAALPIDGHADWSLPNRREARLLHINTPDGFDTDGWYWTSAQHAAYPDSAWVQHFFNGTQLYDHTSGEYRARAVRRVLIIE